ncbi:hypothetical protein J32TS6_00990 [Virgibacillus pantothenticus]|uniref:Endolytic murein transglycosylase n=1 Tax=Virgibacillus pantothenticus TaxID=1473 RepID=A0A0L0QPN2_VIRPA|nr:MULTISPECIES: endolytic transglycosylase MltG [Virgibacillus]API90626.1 hypothetical protein BKP57_01365 [Virgibacillus sp. 6R]KNE20580.1 hypothetical protein AFK71_19700 [Virgibacillus pantothenticus]MBS7429744.1 endolytic transglycosylase MltG [Virgibacillus sp. 19R1-5]MED3737714.1 endolytic transglycosylase MltG [Virgibacillus pantothenticus]QTY17660.1 endolytic transglycosylase MltG [Virgibacillus pantothenticus]
MSKQKNSSKFRDNLMARSEEAKTVRKIVAIIVITLLIILVIGVISGYLYVKSALEPVNPDSNEEIKVTIPIGSSSSNIANILEENGVIKNALVFRFYIKFNNDSNFQAGDYTFSPSMELSEVVDSLKSGKLMAEPVHTVTIPEGKTIDELAEIYAKQLPFTKEEFLKKVNDPDYIHTLMERYPSILSEDILNPEIRTPLEGYLFAATYEFFEEKPSVETVVDEMMKKTESVLSKYLDEIKQKDYTVHEAVTFASVIEKESGAKDQRKKIAGVFANRLEEGMKLQTDPTVLYAQGKHKKRVIYEDLEIESPYNTYYVEGLPVGPIGNFSENSLVAALEPEESDYLYFLHDKNGNIYYAETLEQHNKNKQKHIN